MTVEIFLLLVILVFSIASAIGSIYNAFFIQRPWFKEYQKAGSVPKDHA